jgi:hypothetical protein
MNRRRDVAAIGVAALSLWAAAAACSGSGGSGSGGGEDDGERGLVVELDPIVPPRPAPVDLDALESPSDCAQAGGVEGDGVCVFDCPSTGGRCNDGIECPEGVGCVVYCDEPGSCRGTIQCPSGSGCDVHCGGADSCSGAVLRYYVEGATAPMNLHCAGPRSCGLAQPGAPEDDGFGLRHESTARGNVLCEGEGSCVGPCDDDRCYVMTCLDCEIECRGARSCGAAVVVARQSHVLCSGEGSCAAGVAVGRSIEDGSVRVECTGAGSCAVGVVGEDRTSIVERGSERLEIDCRGEGSCAGGVQLRGGATNAVTCSNGSCAGAVVCSDAWDCEIACSGTSCERLSCLPFASCAIACEAGSCAGPLVCNASEGCVATCGAGAGCEGERTCTATATSLSCEAP